MVFLSQAHQRGGFPPSSAEQGTAGTVQTASVPQRPKAESACLTVQNPSSPRSSSCPIPTEAQASQNQAAAPASLSHG